MFRFHLKPLVDTSRYMDRSFLSSAFRVGILTLLVIVPATGCSYLEHRYGETCNSRAYARAPLAEHLTKRFGRHAPVRLAVIPLAVPANLAAKSDELPGMGNLLAWQLHAELTRTEEIPIVEVLEREDWPGKKEEFFHGDFDAIEYARNAGYDLVLIGYVEPMRNLDSLSVFTKLIEVESGITLWYGKTSVESRTQDANRLVAGLWLGDRRPDELPINTLIDRAARCIAKEITRDDV